MTTYEQEYLTFDEEVTDLWKTQRAGMERVLTAMYKGTLDGKSTVNRLKKSCGCAYGHIGDLDRMQAYTIRTPYREQAEDYFTPLERAVASYQPGQTIENTPGLRALYDHIIAIRDRVYV